MQQVFGDEKAGKSTVIVPLEDVTKGILQMYDYFLKTDVYLEGIWGTLRVAISHQAAAK